jgi:hypothetical protein
LPSDRNAPHNEDMENPLRPAEVIVLIQTHGFDLMAQVEAFQRCVREVQRQVGILKTNDEDARADALHTIRMNADTLLADSDGFCMTLREMQALAAQLSPERRHVDQFVMWDRRRHAAH